MYRILWCSKSKFWYVLTLKDTRYLGECCLFSFHRCVFQTSKGKFFFRDARRQKALSCLLRSKLKAKWLGSLWGVLQSQRLLQSGGSLEMIWCHSGQKLAQAAFSSQNLYCLVLILLGNNHTKPSGPLPCPWLSSSRSPSWEGPLESLPAASHLECLLPNWLEAQVRGTWWLVHTLCVLGNGWVSLWIPALFPGRHRKGLLGFHFWARQ